MVRTTDITHLIAKGLSGREAGRLAVQELAALDRGGQGVLSEKDIRALAVALRTPADGADYERLIALYEALPLMLCEAQVVSLQTERILSDLRCELERSWVSARVADLAQGCGLAISLASDGGSGERAETSEANPAYWLGRLGDVMQLRWLEEANVARGGHSRTELLGLMHEAACRSAAVLLAYVQVIEQASAVLGVAVPTCWARVPRELDVLLTPHESEDPVAELRRSAVLYNNTAQAVAGWHEICGCPVLPSIELDELALDESTVSVLHIRIAHGLGRTGLGDDWWKEKS
ncbi:MAG: hypothetical protein ACLQUT_11605 [Thermoleophilia bacterium]